LSSSDWLVRQRRTPGFGGRRETRRENRTKGFARPGGKELSLGTPASNFLKQKGLQKDGPTISTLKIGNHTSVLRSSKLIHGGPVRSLIEGLEWVQASPGSVERRGRINR